MATITVTEVRARGLAETHLQEKEARTLLEEAVADQTTEREYDIFLSHAIVDADDNDILGTKSLLEDFGYTVYLDWLEDPQLDRSQVSRRTAETLRRRMNCCKSLFYAVTPNSRISRWMQWECGYFDGRKSRTAIFPITRLRQEYYSGVEFVGLYPYVDQALDRYNQQRLWINRSSKIYVPFQDWLNGKEPFWHPS